MNIQIGEKAARFEVQFRDRCSSLSRIWIGILWIQSRNLVSSKAVTDPNNGTASSGAPLVSSVRLGLGAKPLVESSLASVCQLAGSSSCPQPPLYCLQSAHRSSFVYSPRTTKTNGHWQECERATHWASIRCDPSAAFETGPQPKISNGTFIQNPAKEVEGACDRRARLAPVLSIQS